jgi:hypothetical protein
LDRKIIDPLTADQSRERDSIRKENAAEWKRQALLNSAMPKDDFEDILEAVWLDPRKDDSLRDTCNALRAACVSKTLKENGKDGDKFIKQAEALKNRSDCILDKKHVYLLMILIHDAPSRPQHVEVMIQHHEPIWRPKDQSPDGSPNLACYNYRIPNREGP